jgi:hypothetical protein
MKKTQLKKIAPVLLVIGILLLVFGLLYNTTQVLNATVPVVLTSLYAVGYLAIIAATFMFGKKKISYGLAGLGAVFTVWLFL